MKDRLYKLRWVILSLVFWIVAVSYAPREFIDLGGDSAQYIILAESVINGRGLSLINYPKSPPSAFSPLFSILLVPFVYFFGRDFFLMHMLVVGFAYFSLFFFYRMFKQAAGEKIAFFSITLLVLNRLFFSYTFRILTDIPFIFFCSFTLYFIEKYKQKSNIFTQEGLLVAVGLILTYLCRYIGMILFLVILFDFLREKDKRKIQLKKVLFLASLFLPVVLLWMVRCANINNPYIVPFSKQFLLVDYYRPYLGLITQRPFLLFSRILHNINFYFYLTGGILFSPFSKRISFWFFKDVVYFLGIIIILLGVRNELKEKRYLLAVFLVVYISLLLLWPFCEDGRYLLPVVPLIIFYFLRGIVSLWSLLKGSKYLFYVCLTIIMGLSFFSISLKKHSYGELPSSLRNFIEVHKWIKDNLSPKFIIASRKPTITYFYTMHKAITYPFVPIPRIFWEEIKRHNVQYIIVDEFSPESYYYLLPFIREYRSKLKLLHRVGNTGVLCVVRD